MVTPQTKRRIRVSIISKYSAWVIIRAVALIALFIIVVSIYRFGGLEFLGDESTQKLVYDIMLRIVLSFTVWFFLACSKKIIIPAIIITASSALGKLVNDTATAKKTNKAITQYLTYIVYCISLIALFLIWTYHLIGTWISDIIGSGLVIMLTFILGLFSSSVLGNVLGYAILGGTNEFKVGDRVQIGDGCGDVIKVGFFFTRIKTVKDEIISIPNLTVMNKEIHNFSALQDVLLYVPIYLGYDVDKDIVQTTLIEAAHKTNGVMSAPNKEPFVLLRELGPCTITYELNVHINEPCKIAQIKSDLISNMLTELKKAGIDTSPPTYITIKNK
ncbi:MAG: mechanosensitive ion channel family protein [Candidatus Bathyarchaeota archaeon]|nr:mechanosensitive ion channel family protein [Candidatus Termiticorpusculum sp.]